MANGAKSLGKALFTFINILTLGLAGFINKRTKGLRESPEVIRQQFDDAIDQKQDDLKDMMEAVAGQLRVVQQKKHELEKVEKECVKKGKLVSGAIAQARKIVQENGLTQENAGSNPEYKKAMQYHGNFKSTLEQLNTRKAGLNADIAASEKQVEGYERQLLKMQQDIKDLEGERERSVADVTMAKSQRDANAAAAALKTSSADDDIRKIRETIGQVKAEAEVTGRMAGIDNENEEANFLEALEAEETSSDFDDAIFGPSEKAAPVAAPVEEQKSAELPES